MRLRLRLALEKDKKDTTTLEKNKKDTTTLENNKN